MRIAAHVIGWLIAVVALMVGAAFLWVWVSATFINKGGDVSRQRSKPGID